MIVNLQSTKTVKINDSKFEIIFPLPKIYFDQWQHVHVNEICITWISTPANYAMLQSTLIDKSPTNIDQQLLFIYSGNKTPHTFYAPTHTQEYKIQRAELQSSQFYIATSEKANIKKVYLQLYFSDARIQQINKR